MEQKLKFDKESKLDLGVQIYSGKNKKLAVKRKRFDTSGNNKKLIDEKKKITITIEPGIYISSKMDVDDKWKGIGVRIEDDILVTKDGNENLTKKVPSDPNEIESLMS